MRMTDGRSPVYRDWRRATTRHLARPGRQRDPDGGVPAARAGPPALTRGCPAGHAAAGRTICASGVPSPPVTLGLSPRERIVVPPVGKPGACARRKCGATWPIKLRRHLRGQVPHRGRGGHGDARVEDDRLPARALRRAARRSASADRSGFPRTRSTSTCTELLPDGLSPDDGWQDTCTTTWSGALSGSSAPLISCPDPSGSAPWCLAVRLGPSGRGRRSPVGPRQHQPRKVPRGFRHQEASQAHGQEEAPQAAEEDPRTATSSRQVSPSLG